MADRSYGPRIGAGEGAVLHLSFSVRRRDRLPKSLVHEFRLVSEVPSEAAPDPIVQIGARSKVNRRAPVCSAHRFAIDWERLDAEGRLFTGDKRVLTNWEGYGENIYAVAGGTVMVGSSSTRT